MHRHIHTRTQPPPQPPHSARSSDARAPAEVPCASRRCASSPMLPPVVKRSRSRAVLPSVVKRSLRPRAVKRAAKHGANGKYARSNARAQTNLHTLTHARTHAAQTQYKHTSWTHMDSEAWEPLAPGSGAVAGAPSSRSPAFCSSSGDVSSRPPDRLPP